MKFQKLFLIATATLLSVPAFAGALTDKAYQVAAQLGGRESTLSPQQSAQVQRDLDSILAVLNGGAAERGYFCVSRDNDNSRPFVVAFKDFANVVRVPGAVFSSKEECDRSIAGGFRAMNRLFICATRDNDGSRPFKVVGLNGTRDALLLQRSVLGSLEDCLTAVRSMQVRPEGVLYCGSRDNDGNRPFSQTGLKYDGSFVHSREEYGSLGECTSAL